MSLASKLLADYGARRGVPTIVNDDYAVLWSKFLKTQTAHDLSTLTDSKYLVASAFLSYLSKTKKAIKRPVDYRQHNLLYARQRLQEVAKVLQAVLDKSTLRRDSRISHSFSVDHEINDFINACTDIRIVGYIVCDPKGMKYEKLLDRQQKLLFRARIPRTLFRRSTLSLQRLKTVNNAWYYLRKPDRGAYSLEVARSAENFLVLRYVIDVEFPLFYGQTKPADAVRNLTAAWRTTFKHRG